MRLQPTGGQKVAETGTTKTQTRSTSGPRQNKVLGIKAVAATAELPVQHNPSRGS